LGLSNLCERQIACHRERRGKAKRTMSQSHHGNRTVRDELNRTPEPEPGE
jgi:hypothetical protein